MTEESDSGGEVKTSQEGRTRVRNREATGQPARRRRRLLATRRQLPDFPWDAVSVWATWVFGFTFGPLLVQIIIYDIIKQTTPEVDLERALTVFLIWCLVVGLGLVGLGQYLQALASRWPSATGRFCRAAGSLVGLGGWSVGLLAGIGFPIVDKKVPESSDPTSVVFVIALVVPTAIWGAVTLVRSSWLWWRQCRVQQSRDS